ncbi:hypothetical protein [Endozoicomonas sp. ONNA2]|uniref:hypothetical protein n=1 Tax=Endozoicomonas sp. ONNA2 TaxID=2828741 RepID=UPI0021473694|nr:hypothetical protein [Endozoicomonas sp. ONNA2]
MLSTSGSLTKTYNIPADDTCKDNQIGMELANNKASWNGYDLFTATPITVFSRNEGDVHFNKLLQFEISTAVQEQQTAVSLDKTNPFITHLALKDEEEFNEAIKNLVLSESHALDNPPDKIEAETGFNFFYAGICYKSEYTPEELKLFPIAKALNNLSDRIKSDITLQVDRHFHTTKIPADLMPHEDPVTCKLNDLPNTDGNQSYEMAYNCDYLFTTVRSVNDEAMQTDHLCLYLASKGLGNTNAKFQIRAIPEITDDLYAFFSSINRKEPAALRLCKIDNKPGAGYAINQNAEYTINIKPETDGFEIKCCNNEQQQQLLFRKSSPLGSQENSSPVNPKEVIEEFNRSNISNPIKFKVLHGYEVAKIVDATSSTLLSKSNSESEPAIKRDILIGRLAVRPREEDLPQFHEKKSTRYTLGPKFQI